jgi:ubiquinone/menaquinone biosynthesis C-methylase UbiE
MTDAFKIVNRAFSKQSVHYDADDSQNIILKDWRKQVYNHVDRFLKPEHRMLELNAGTGLDAFHFASQGNKIHATDLSDGMIHEIEKKVQLCKNKNLTCQQLSYDQLNKLTGSKFDYVFSNFGGLNCIQDLNKVTRQLPDILNSGAYITWVIMPKVYLWELAGVLKGHGKKSFRRLKKGGVMAHLEGEYFATYYHSLSQIKKAFGSSFTFIQSEGLGVLSPPPHRDDFAKNKSSLYSFLRNMDRILKDHSPFNQWADHIIVTFQYHKG